MADQWVEILEPKTRVKMFANLRTGECRWDEPQGQQVVVSRAHNQWWELFDPNSQRFYYYCAKDSKTVWRRPTTDDAVVVPLAKLQIINSRPKTSDDDKRTTPDDSSHKSVAVQTEPQLVSRSTQTGFEANYSMNSFRNPSLKHYLISEARLTHAMKAHELDIDSNDDDFDDMIEDSDLSCDADDEYDCDYSDDDDSDDELDAITSRYERRADDQSDGDDNRRLRDDKHDDRRQKINSLFAAQTSPTSSGHSVAAAGQSAPTKSHSLTQISANIVRSDSKRLTTQMTTPTTRPQTPPNNRQILSLAPTTTPTTRDVRTTTEKTTDSKEKKEKSSLLSIESFAKENIERHRKRGIFIGKRVSMKSMLEWSRKSIRKPMISSISDQKLRHESKVMFRFVQRFMRDLTTGDDTTTADGRHLTSMDDTDVALYLLTVAAQQPILRDELLVQIARQTTNNPSEESELRGLRLMCACFWYFGPSQKLLPHLEAFVSSHKNVFASSDVKRKFEQQLRRQKSSHVVYVRKPADREEVARVLRCVEAGFPGVYGECLQDALVRGRRVPWPIVCLTEALLRCHSLDTSGAEACEREGVFRCVGDLDEVMRLKIKMDTVIKDVDALKVDINYDDIHVIASALKLYFRELKEPVIPFPLYFEALDSAHEPTRAQRLVDALPEVNRLALSYLVRFLQVFSAPEHVLHTKMDDANLSMVWAPNLLRCPLEGGHEATPNLSSIFERTRGEMSFVRTLIQHMDTSFMSGIQ